MQMHFIKIVSFYEYESMKNKISVHKIMWPWNSYEHVFAAVVFV